MKQIITALSILLLLTSCIEKENKSAASYQPNWATADFRKIESEIFKMAVEKNPYPDPKVDKREIQQEKSRISSQISNIKKEACHLKTDRTTKGSKHSNSKPIAFVSSSPTKYDHQCFSQMSTNPLIVNLNKQKQELDKLNRKLSAHTQKVRAFATDQTKKLIKNYSNEKFEVVVRQGRDTVLYNKDGISFDITDALMQEIDANKLSMQKKEDKPLDSSKAK